MLRYITHIIHCPFCSSVSQFTLIILDIAITYISQPWTDLTLTSQLVLGVMARVANFLILPILFKEVFYNFFYTSLFPNSIAARYTIRTAKYLVMTKCYDKDLRVKTSCIILNYCYVCGSETTFCSFRTYVAMRLYQIRCSIVNMRCN